MRILLGSGGFRTPERIALLTKTMRSHFGTIARLLFFPYALQDHDRYVATVFERGYDAGYQIDSIHLHPDPIRAVWEAEGLFIGGGNTFRLLHRLYGLQLLDVIRTKVRGGLPYLGISAGCNVACPTIKTTNDMPIVEPPSLQALGLVPFQVNAHYFPGAHFYQDAAGAYQAHFGETRDDRIREFHEENHTPVVGLWEGGLLRCEGDHIDLIGTPARIFFRGQPPIDLQPGADLKSYLADGGQN
jgi:dipeptidase E